MSSSYFFSDPVDCRRYFDCFNFNKAPAILETQLQPCQNGYYYNSKNRGCVRQTSSSQCVTTTCAKGQIQVWTPDPQFWIMCYDNVPLMNRCSKFETYVIGKGCFYKCPGEGRYEHEDKYSYYECYKSGSDLISIVKKCSGGWPYNPKQRKCDIA